MSTPAMSSEDQQIAEQAAEWVVKLSEVSADQQQARQREFECWKRADGRHAQAAAQIETFLQPLNTAGSSTQQAAGKAIKAGLNEHDRQQRRGAFAKPLVILLAAGFLFTGLFQTQYAAYLMADISNEASVWQQHQLPDGSDLQMAGKGAIELHFTEQERVVELLGGAIRVDVAPDTVRPFKVRTSNGTITALGTRFIVRHNDNGKTHLTMLESRVRINTTQTHESKAKMIKAGQRTAFTDAAVEQPTELNVTLAEHNWQGMQLAASNWTLGEVLTELNRFHPALLIYNADQLNAIKVSTTLPLDKPEKALALLVTSFPEIKLTPLTSHVMIIDLE